MKNSILLFLSAIVLAACTPSAEPLEQVLERGLQTARAQALLLARRMESLQDRLPQTYEDGELKTITYKDWVSGFFPGTLWLLYEDEPSEELLGYARLFTQRVEPAKLLTTTHDLGFMLFCSFGNGFRLTNDPRYMEVLVTGANSLATRYKPTVGAIQSWQSNDRWQCPVIIDNMMNLELLEFVGKATDNENLLRIADKHAYTTIANHFREDYSSYHVVSYDTLTGTPHFKGTHQGYDDESAWSRGQAWALYGFTMMYRETSNPDYLAQALHIADFIANHPNLPEDKIPYWDFDVPALQDTQRDASAAAVMASALIELSQLDTTASASQWLQLAEQMLRSLSSPTYLAQVGTNGGFTIMHGVRDLHHNVQVDVPLTYADYYYIEAILRWKKLKGIAE